MRAGAELSLDAVDARLNLRARDFRSRLGEHEMAVGMAADGGKRIVLELCQSAPIQAELATDTARIDAGALAKPMRGRTHLNFVGDAAEPPVDGVKSLVLGGIGCAIEAAQRAVDRNLQRRA